jgi:hypothetical protein
MTKLDRIWIGLAISAAYFMILMPQVTGATMLLVTGIAALALFLAAALVFLRTITK